ncbi:major facilitator superfamily domain-containing protein [Aspergillus pseudonomiae]|uniref:Major facilitator superfamily domain-containing protein n=1 Tax=Aspergillus pseudonomiae TaxID=1506151 RepID=A0A5N6I3E1_9EURO|nr:major facilitator superfamily domain-containing protein [Aspergillus pseudonomiae]KAB8261202.1 major facilitator superfamily domain-containing protein [Aspergillus pseudonomiae]KAE8403709.1 major facilitator superfamily domain-containing protein [Aspergillus pseudonomiae]
MAPTDDILTDVPGTVYLVDTSGNLADAAHANDILLLPQPSCSAADPLNWPKYKKYWTLCLISAYACVNSFGENNWGASWTTISDETGVSLENMNGGSALNYLMLGFFNIIWIPTAMKFGRKIVYILSLIFVGASGIWGAFYVGTGQYYVMTTISGMGTAAYQALIQLTIFDTFFAHERGRMIAIYIFFQQLGSILGLILGGYISDGIGWRWSMPIVAIACGVLILLFIFTFDDTMFPRYRFSERTPSETLKGEQSYEAPPEIQSEKPQKEEPHMSVTPSNGAGEVDMPPRTYFQKIALVHYFKDDQTTWFQYFRRPFYLFAFPNIVLAGIQFAFGCTAGIVSFNTISEIMTEAPYNWSNGSTGLLFLSALIGSFFGMGVGSLSDWLVLVLARRNKGYKEPEMRLWAYVFPLIFAALGYFIYGWGATAGAHWMTIAVGLCCMIAQQVSATSIATAYAMECFDKISGELVIVLAICSSVINFAISFTVQHFINATNYGWAFTFYGICVVLSMAMGVPMLIWGKSWRRRGKGRYEKFLAETGRQS